MDTLLIPHAIINAKLVFIYRRCVAIDWGLMRKVPVNTDSESGLFKARKIKKANKIYQIRNLKRNSRFLLHLLPKSKHHKRKCLN